MSKVTTLLLISLIASAGQMALAGGQGATIHLHNHQRITKDNADKYDLDDLLNEQSRGSRSEDDYASNKLCFEGSAERAVELVEKLVDQNDPSAIVEKINTDRAGEISFEMHWKKKKSPFVLTISACRN